MHVQDLAMQNLDAKLIKTLGIVLAINAAWIIPLVSYRWLQGLPLTAQGPTEDPTTTRFRLKSLFAIGLMGGLSVAALIQRQYMAGTILLVMCVALVLGLRHIDARNRTDLLD